MRIFVLCFCVVLSGVAAANDGCGSNLKSLPDFVTCVTEKSPEVENARLDVERARASVDAAGQWRNPELSAESFQGKKGGFEQASTDLSLRIPIELGSKISARQAVARGGASTAEARLELTRFKMKSETLLKLHRLRQVLHEQEIIDEAIGTFTRLVNQYRSRPGLSPEQQTSSSVYQLAKEEYEMQKISVADEVLALETFFKLQAGVTLEALKSRLPGSPEKWPQVPARSAEAVSPVQKLLRAEVEAAQAEMSVARGESWPTIVVGPSMQIVKEAGQTNTLMGFNVSLPLPLFNVNGAGRASAAAGLKAVEAKTRSGLREQELRGEELRKVYEQSVKALSGGISHAEIERRHHESEKLFLKGVVPSALVIDAHRTSLDLERIRHEREIRAIQALLEIAVMEGRLQEVSL